MSGARILQSVLHQRYLRWTLPPLLAGVLSFAGCAVGPKYKVPTAPAPSAYKEMGDWKTAQPSDQNLGGNWWELFGDPQLNALEQQINVSNQNIKAAVAQYQQARAVLRYYRADYYPTLTAGASASRNRYSNNRPPASSIFNGVTYNDFTIPVQLSYETNAFGRVTRNVESYRAQAQASSADLAVVSLSMHADLAVDYFAARTLDAEEKLLQDNVTQYEQALELNTDLYQGGLASEVEVEQAKTILETTRAEAVDVGVARAQYEHAAAVLLGKPPADFTLPPLPLTTPPPPIPVGVPSELLERRPDIAAAERQVASANAQIGLAKAAYYPLINIVAEGGLESGAITTLFQGPSALGRSERPWPRPSSMGAGGVPPRMRRYKDMTTPSLPIAKPFSPPFSRWKIISPPYGSLNRKRAFRIRPFRLRNARWISRTFATRAE